MLENGLAVNEFLSDKSSGSEHRKASVLDLLNLHGLEFRRILGAEAEGVEADVSGGVVVPQEELIIGRVRGGHPANLSAVNLGNADGNDEGFPEGTGNLREVVDGGAADLRVKEEASTNETDNVVAELEVMRGAWATHAKSRSKSDVCEERERRTRGAVAPLPHRFAPLCRRHSLHTLIASLLDTSRSTSPRAFDLLANEEAEDSKHGHAAVSQFGLAVALALVLVGSVQEP